MDATFYINHLKLQPHPEGGFYREIYRAAEGITADALPVRFSGDRNFSTSIYYLLQQGEYSAFHCIKSDEGWHFYAGGTLLIHIIDRAGNYKCQKLGSNLAEGEEFQFVVPAMVWFASEPAPGAEFILGGCTVSPGFDFADFEMADKKELLKSFPQHKNIIERLCKEIILTRKNQ